MDDKNRFKIIITYNNQRKTMVRLFQAGRLHKSELTAFSRLFNRCSYMQGYSGLNNILDFCSHEGLADDIIEIGLALGIPVKYVPEAKPKKERRHGEEKLNRLVDVVRRA